MKIWAKFNAGFQLCPPDFNFAPWSREAGDAPESGPGNCITFMKKFDEGLR